MSRLQRLILLASTASIIVGLFTLSVPLGFIGGGVLGVIAAWALAELPLPEDRR